MTTIQIDTSSPYHVLIGQGILHTLGDQICSLGGAEKICLVSDTHVWQHYGQPVINALTAAGLSVHPFVFPAGEQSKNGSVFLNILDHMARWHMTRRDVVVALGGGVVGDMAGFCAACYMRGIRFVQVPTTVLAAVDSSVGGKTAIDLPSGKNLAGAFHQPSLVLCDLDCLDSLPADIFRDGCAEIIKTAILFDPELFALLERDAEAFCQETVVSRCVSLKAEVVRTDEQEHGIRQLLNLGHTIGHGVELSSDYAVSHGSAVAIGTAIVCRSAARLGICDQETSRRIQSLLERFSLPVRTDFTAEELSRAALSDKKRNGGSVNLILPHRIGQCAIHPTPIGELKSLIQAGL